MNENLDLTKILGGCPEGTIFYSIVYGEISFKRIELYSNYPIIFYSDEVGGEISLTKKGTASRRVGECIVFPSKDQRDWSKFERFWDNTNAKKFDIKTLQPFDKVLVRDEPRDHCIPNFFWTFTDEPAQAICLNLCWQQCVPYNEETKNLIGTKEDCPEYYKWWNE